MVFASTDLKAPPLTSMPCMLLCLFRYHALSTSFVDRKLKPAAWVGLGWVELREAGGGMV